MYQTTNDEQTQTPLDSIISRVDSYIQDPKLVTPDTLMELKTELEDLKGYVENEPQEAEVPDMASTMAKMKGVQA